MTEVLPQGFNNDPILPDTAENYLPLEDPEAFFEYALLEGAEITERPPTKKGPFFDQFMEVMQTTDAMLKQRVNPECTAEYLMPTNYRSHEVQQRLAIMSDEQKLQLDKINEMKYGSLRNIAANDVREAMTRQTLQPGLLNVPLHTRQAGGGDMRGCTAACFRMVFGEITGWVPSQKTVVEQLAKQYGTSVVDDSVLSNIYQTDIFKEICDKKVRAISYMGADFETISTLTARLKAVQPNVEVYCTVNLGSETAIDKGVWHACVLLSADGECVTYHDPSTLGGGAHKTSSYADFTKRWAIAYNRAVITIAV